MTKNQFNFFYKKKESAKKLRRFFTITHFILKIEKTPYLPTFIFVNWLI
jgi:hypothetical protein